MRKLYIALFALLFTSSIYSQIKYDDGPIMTGSRFATNGTWGRGNITYSFKSGTNDIANNDEQNALRQAFQIWENYANLNFTEVTDNADILILWGSGNHVDGYPFDGTNGVLAHAFFPPPDGGIFSGDIHFDDDEMWTLAPQINENQPIDLVTVAAHEIGHALGLGHSNIDCSLMYPLYTGSHRYLGQDDINGIQSIYGNRNVLRTLNLNCAGGVFYISNLPEGANVLWTSSNTAVASVSNNLNQGTVSRVGSSSGTVRITGTITLPCGALLIEFMDISIGLGANSINFTLKEITCVNGRPYFFGAVYPIPFASYSYDWYSKDESNPNNPFVLRQTGLGNTADFPLGNNKGNRYYTIRVILTNPCGTLQSIDDEGYLYAPSCLAGIQRVIVSPNPVNSTLNISFSKMSNDEKNFIDDNIETIEIRNKSGILMVNKKFSKGITKTSINVSALKSDIYILSVWNGKVWTSEEFIKQ